MGRKADHLALGIGKAAGATLAPARGVLGPAHPAQTVVDTLAGAIIKAQPRPARRVAILAEGLVLNIGPADLAQVERSRRTRTATCASTRSTSARS